MKRLWCWLRVILLGSLMLGVVGCGKMGIETIGESVSDNDVVVSGNGAEAEGADTDEIDLGEGIGEGFGGRDEIWGNGEQDVQGDGEGVAGSGSEDEEEGIERREAVKVKGIYVSGPIAGHERMDELIELVDETELNAMVIDVKNDEGRITYKMQTDTVLEIGAGVGYIRDIDELIKKCKEKDIYLIARIVAFRDPYLAEQRPELAVKTLSGETFRDKNGLAWVNPYKKEVWDYLMEVAKGAIASGFDEIQFDYIRFSTDLSAGETTFGPEAETISKIDIITQFTEYAYETLAPLGAYVAADVFGTVIDNESDQAIVGQDYVQMAQHLDYICPMVYPSHYVNGAYGIPIPDAEPYRTIQAAMNASAKALDSVSKENRAKVRVWLQSFTAGWVSGHISYGREQIRDQIKGAYDTGYEEWILWNASVNYQRDSLLTVEEAEAERERWETQKTESASTVSGN